jgi:hypothetical protein
VLFRSVVAADANTFVSLADAVVQATRPRGVSAHGDGIEALGRARLDAVRVLVTDNHEAGVVASGPGTTIALTDVAVQRTRARPNDGLFGRGLAVQNGARLDATRALVADNRELGAGALNAESAVALTDVLVVDVAPSARGFGGGAMAFGGARLALARVAVTGVSGVGTAAVPFDDARNGRVADARLDGRDVFVRGVRSSTIRFDDTGSTSVPTGRLVAYGLHAGRGCGLALAQAVVTAGGFGFFTASDATFALRTGVVTGQLDAFGASNTAPDAVVLTGVARFGNAVNDVLRGLDLP